MSRRSGLALLATACALLWCAAAQARLRPVHAAHGVKPAYGVRADVRPGHPAVLRTLRIAHTGAGVIKWRCAGTCRRGGGPATRITHPSGSTVIAHMNLRLRGRMTLTIEVVVPGGQSRYLAVATDGARLRVTKAGCITAAGRPGACAAAPSPTPPVAPSPTPSPAPTPVAPANNPDGRLTQIKRVDPAHAEAIGWASDADAPNAPLTVRALVEGSPAAEASAAVFTLAFGPHGFDFLVPVDSYRHTVCVEALNVGGGNDAVLNGCQAVPEVGDLNDDGYVGCADLRELQGEYGTTGSHLPGDLNDDGKVDIFDLSLLESHYHAAPGDPNPCPTS